MRILHLILHLTNIQCFVQVSVGGQWTLRRYASMHGSIRIHYLRMAEQNIIHIGGGC